MSYIHVRTTSTATVFGQTIRVRPRGQRAEEAGDGLNGHTARRPSTDLSRPSTDRPVPCDRGVEIGSVPRESLEIDRPTGDGNQNVNIWI